MAPHSQANNISAIPFIHMAAFATFRALWIPNPDRCLYSTLHPLEHVLLLY